MFFDNNLYCSLRAYIHFSMWQYEKIGNIMNSCEMKTKKFRINILLKVTTIMPQFHWLYSQVSLTSKQQISIFYGVWFMHKVLVFPCQMYFKSSIFQILDATKWKWPLMQILQQHLTATCESLLCNESQFRKVTLHTCSSLELMSIVSPHYTLSLTQK